MFKHNNRHQITSFVKNISSKIEKIFADNAFLLLHFTVGILLLIIYRDYISLKYNFIFKDIGCDTIGYNYPNFVCVSDYIRNNGLPSWSFQQGIGQNMFPINCGDPFNTLIFLANKTLIPYIIVFVELLKIYLIAVFSFLTLEKRKLSPFTCLIGACMLSFSGFVVLGGTWYCFSTEAFYFILLIFGFENIYNNNKKHIFIIAIFLIASSQPINIIVFGFFLLLYGSIRIISEYSNTYSKSLKCVSDCLLYGLIGIGLSAIFLFPIINQLAHSPRVIGNSSLFKQLFSQGIKFESKEYYGTSIMRFFSSDILGGGNGYSGWHNYLEAPLFYCSLPLLLLLPQVFIKAIKKEKILYSTTIFVLLVTIIFPFFRQAIWMFSGDYFRFYSFGVLFILVLFSLHALHKIISIGKIHVLTLLITLSILLIFLYSSSFFNVDPVKEIRNIVTLFLCLYTLFLFLLNFKSTQILGKSLLFICLCIELIFMSNKTVNDRTRVLSSDLSNRSGYNDYFIEANNFIKSKDHSFYRINKTYLAESNNIFGTCNDSRIQNYRGCISYSPFNQLQYITFFQNAEGQDKNIDGLSRICFGYWFRPILQILCNVKYTVSNGSVSPFISKTNDSLTTFQDVSIWKNRLFLPMGITYSNYMSMSDYQKLSINKKDNALLNSFILDSCYSLKIEGLKQLTEKDLLDTIIVDSISKYVKARKEDTLQIRSFSETHFDGTISLKSKKLLFLAIPNDEGWHATIDGNETKIETVSAGLMGIMLEKGNHTVKLEFIRPFFKLGIIVSLCFLMLIIGISIYKKKSANEIR